MKFKAAVLISILALAVLIAGCGGDGAGYPDAKSTDTAQSSSTEETGSTDEESSKSSKPGKPPKVSGSLNSKPKIAETSGTPPEQLITKDIKEGSGKAAKDGDKVSVQYVGKNWSNNEEFDASWGRGEPFEFTLGEGGVIQGWDQGVVGMKKGGRRLLVIPPDLGYGASGQGNIPANETLVFVVDLEDIN